MKQEKKLNLSKEFFRKNHLLFGMAIFAAVLGIASNLLISWLLQQVIDTATGGEDAIPLLTLVYIGLGCVLVVLLEVALSSYAEPRFLKRAMRQYKDTAFRELMKKGMSAFSGENTSTYISALSNDTNSIETNYLSQISSLISGIGLFVGAFIMMLIYSPILTLVAFLLTFLPVLVTVLAGGRLAAADQVVSKRSDTFLGILKDSLSGFSVIKSFKAERAILKQFAEGNREAENAKEHRRRLQSILQGVGSLTGLIAQFGVFFVGAWLALSGSGVTPGVVIVFVQLMNFIVSPVQTLPVLFANRKSSRALVKKLSDLLSENVRDEGADIPQKLESGIEVKHVRFGYEEEKEILHDVSVFFAAGKSYAIVGGSGSGKSTLLNLLMASNNSYSGEILYDGTELKGISSKSLYDLVSIIQQNVFVFNNTMHDNVTMFSSFDESDVSQAMELSGLTELVKERGAEYLCGENGCNLSGGEKQRISIARSLLRKTPVLIVDEATAALDAETAFKVSSAILNLSNLTRIVVTHTLDEALLRRYDEIVALKNGQIVEQGVFSDLMEKKGYFYSLFTVSQS